MKIFVTGATGFVGHHVAKALADQGADLRLLVRKSSKLSNLEGIAGDTVVGDLSRPDSYAPALQGCDAVLHVAADYRLWIRDPDMMYRANVDGTRDLLKLAREARIRRVVYTSSVATMAFRTDGIVVNEDTPVSISDMVGHYKRSKFLAEQQAIAAAEDGQHPVGDGHLLHTQRGLLQLRAGLAAGIERRHQAAGRGADHELRLEPGFLEHGDHAHMGKTARRTAAQRQPHTHRLSGGLRRRRHGRNRPGRHDGATGQQQHGHSHAGARIPAWLA